MSNNSTITENPAPMRQFRGKALWAALATLLDGEGSIFMVKERGTSNYRVVISTGNVCARWMEAWQRRLCRGRVDPGETPEGCKQIFRWRIDRKADVAYILKRVLPYLFVKRTQALLALDYIENKGVSHLRQGLSREGRKISAQELAWREECYQRMRSLNTKGNPERLYVEHPILGGDIVRSVEPSTELDGNDQAQ